MVLIKNPVWHMLAKWISNALSEKKWWKRELETVRMGGPGEGDATVRKTRKHRKAGSGGKLKDKSSRQVNRETERKKGSKE